MFYSNEAFSVCQAAFYVGYAKIFGVDVKSLRRTGVRSLSARFNWRTDDLFYTYFGVDRLNPWSIFGVECTRNAPWSVNRNYSFLVGLRAEASFCEKKKNLGVLAEVSSSAKRYESNEHLIRTAWN